MKNSIVKKGEIFMLCKLSNVSKTIKNNQILNNITLEIQKNKIIGIVGHNGSGKTMLLRAICGLIVPDEGTIKYYEDIDFGIIIEEPGFMDEHSAYDNLKYLADINKKIGKDKIMEILSIVGLKGKESNKVKTFSLGMKKKLAIAQAIMENQNLLLLDEPFNALDEDSSLHIQNILKSYVNKDNAIVIVSHHSSEIENLCDEIYKMNNGELSKI